MASTSPPPSPLGHTQGHRATLPASVATTAHVHHVRAASSDAIDGNTAGEYPFTAAAWAAVRAAASPSSLLSLGSLPDFSQPPAPAETGNDLSTTEGDSSDTNQYTRRSTSGGIRISGTVPTSLVLQGSFLSAGGHDSSSMYTTMLHAGELTTSTSTANNTATATATAADAGGGGQEEDGQQQVGGDLVDDGGDLSFSQFTEASTVEVSHMAPPAYTAVVPAATTHLGSDGKSVTVTRYATSSSSRHQRQGSTLMSATTYTTSNSASSSSSSSSSYTAIAGGDQGGDSASDEPLPSPLPALPAALRVDAASAAGKPPKSPRSPRRAMLQGARKHGSTVAMRHSASVDAASARASAIDARLRRFATTEARQAAEIAALRSRLDAARALVSD